MITDADFQALKVNVERIDKILGDWTRQIDKKDLPPLLVPENEIPGSGQYSVDIALRAGAANASDQRDLIDGQAEEIRLLKLKPGGTVGTPPPPPPPPPPSADTIPPLTAAQQTALATALQHGVTGGRLQQSLVDQIITDAAAGRYAICDQNVDDLVSGWYYDTSAGVTQADQAAIAPYLFTIIHQSDPVTGKLMSPTDPRVKQVSGAVPAPAPTGNGSVKGGRLLHIGPEGQALTDALASNETGVLVVAGSVPGTGTAAHFFASALPAVRHMMYANGGDRSFRKLFNYKPNFTTSDPSLCQMGEDWEQDGVISWRWIKPANTSPGPWDGGDRKVFALGLAGHGGTNQMGKYVQLYSTIPGRGVQIGAVDAGNPQNVVTRMGVTVDGDGSPNPVLLFADGSEQRVVVKTVNGVRVFAPE